jgi:hypothetical protein
VEALLDQTAMSIAARDLGFHGVAKLIVEQELSAPAVFSVFAVAASDKATKQGAIVILSAAHARFNADIEHWNGGTVERDLALLLLGEDFRFDEANRLAARIVQRHWGEIQKFRGRNFSPAYRLNGRDKHGKCGASHPTIEAR